MKIMNLTNVEGFLKTVNSCQGSVELVTKDGDRLNLKSELTKYVALTSFFTEAKIPEMELVLSEPGDAMKLVGFIQGN